MDGKLPARLGTLQLQFDWPWQLANGKWLLYLTRVEVGGASETRCNPPGNIVNPLNLTVNLANHIHPTGPLWANHSVSKLKKTPSNQLSPEQEEEEGRGRSLEQGQELIGQREAAVLPLHGHQREPYTLVVAVLPQCNTAEWPEGAPSCLMTCVSACVCVVCPGLC